MAEASMTDKLKSLVSEALDKYSHGDQVDWDIGSGMGPNNQLFHFLTLVVPSPVLGENIMAGGVIGGANNIDGSKIDTMVNQALEQIRAARTQKLNESLAQVPVTETASGLVLPGQ
jgi:hypothetical protein